jgi:hypothetical protein
VLPKVSANKEKAQKIRGNCSQNIPHKRKAKSIGLLATNHRNIVNGKMSTFIHILTGFEPRPLLFSLTAGRKHSH